MKNSVVLLFGFLTLSIVIGSASIWFSIEQYEIYEEVSQDIVPSTDRVEQNSYYTKALSLAQGIIFILIFFTFGSWFYSAYEDLKALEVKNLRYQPNQIFLAFLIPVINFVKPYSFAQEIWKASTSNEENWQKNKKSKLVSLWWLCFACSLILGYVSGVSIAFSDQVSTFKNALASLIIADSLLIVSAISAMKMVAQIEKKQKQMYQNIHA